MNAMISKVVSKHQKDWNEFLTYVVVAYRSSCHEVTGFSPNFLLFAKETRAPLDMVYGRPSKTSMEGSTDSDYTLSLEERMDKAYNLVRQHFKRAAERRKQN